MLDGVGRVVSGELADALAGLDLERLTDAEFVDVIAEWERVASWVAARQLAAIAAFTRRREAAGEGEFPVDEVALAIGLSRAAAGDRLHIAEQLDRRLPATAEALGRGQINLPKVRAVVDATAVLDPAVAAAVEQRVLPDAEHQTVGQLRAALAKAVLVEDPGGAEARHERARQGRKVTLHPQPEGMSGLWALLPADAAAAVYSAIDAHARQQPADDRGMDARRADALIAIITGADTTPMQPLVQITVRAGTLLGEDEAPAELAGYGPIPAGMARRIAEDVTGTWRRILTDPATGAVLDVGRTSYRPPAALIRHVIARDATCRFPGRRQPARRCDLDHIQPWPTGPTAANNLIALCRRHHRLKHSGRWQITAGGGNTLTWTTPAGRKYTTHPPPIGPRSKQHTTRGQPQNSALPMFGRPGMHLGT
jgi:hypothetical protein